jgi:hypothetical protein
MMSANMSAGEAQILRARIGAALTAQGGQVTPQTTSMVNGHLHALIFAAADALPIGTTPLHLSDAVVADAVRWTQWFASECPSEVLDTLVPFDVGWEVGMTRTGRRTACDGVWIHDLDEHVITRTRNLAHAIPATWLEAQPGQMWISARSQPTPADPVSRPLSARAVSVGNGR